MPLAGAGFSAVRHDLVCTTKGCGMLIMSSSRTFVARAQSSYATCHPLSYRLPHLTRIDGALVVRKHPRKTKPYAQSRQ
jgi:hypothetical protein